MNSKLPLPSLTACFAIALCVALSGCQTLSPKKVASVEPAPQESKLAMPKVSMPWSDDELPPVVSPDRVVGTWSEAVLHQNGQGTRGFGGRLYFYDRSSSDPVRVDGQLVVYAFIEDDRQETDHKPTKRYVFPPEQFAKHESSSEIGVSYSVWLPWDAAGGQQTEVSLIARFEPSQGGGLVVSDQTRHRLPGTPRPDTLLAEKKSKRISQSSVVQAAALGSSTGKTSAAHFQQGVEQSPAQLTATTISLPRQFQGFGSRQLSTHKTPKVATLPTAASPAATPSSAATQASAAASPTAVSQPSATGGPTTSVPLGQSSTDQPQATPFGTTIRYQTVGESISRAAGTKF